MYKVSFTEKNGTQGVNLFPTKELADMYASTVKNGKVLEGGTESSKVVFVKSGQVSLLENAKRLQEAKDRAAQIKEKEVCSNDSRANDTSDKSCACGNKAAKGCHKCLFCRRYG